MTPTHFHHPLPPLDPATIDVWIFDLDNTLYPASCNLFAQVSQRIGEYISRALQLPPDEARLLQKSYFRRYGTTLRGLMVEHGLDPLPFLAYVHDIDVTPVPPAPELRRVLQALPGRRLIYTNGSVRHAQSVLERLGVTDQFEDIFDIVAADFLPKPDPRPYQVLLRQHGVEPGRAVMVEDIARNLEPAAALGMTTAWIRGDSPWSNPEPSSGDAGTGSPSHIHHVVDDLTQWLSQLTRTPLT